MKSTHKEFALWSCGDRPSANAIGIGGRGTGWLAALVERESLERIGRCDIACRFLLLSGTGVLAVATAAVQTTRAAKPKFFVHLFVDLAGTRCARVTVECCWGLEPAS